MMATPCRRAACDGAIEDGYCDSCGLAAEATRADRESAGPPQGAQPPREAKTERLRAVPYSRAVHGSRRVPRPPKHSARKPLGAGLITLPDLPSIAPEAAILADPMVPEGKRYCPKCDARVRRETGYCGKCGGRYHFVPTLRAGDLVANQYEVRGPIAYGGLGWIYLAFDRLLSRYVVLKGLLNTQDDAAAAAAVAERQFLAAVKHPNIVGIYSFVQVGSEGFIVMEYVGGKTLKQLRQERGPLPPAEALAYIYRILPAFAHLHRLGLVFCDFKPDNVMLEQDDLKLIDLGGVRRVDDPGGDIYGTVGYSAPEAAEGPSAASDLFTVGRTLAVLLMEMAGFGGESRYTLPAPEDKLVLQEHPSMYRFLLKATAQDPADRFETADEMAEQLLGVLREVVACGTGQPRPGSSREFGADLLALDAGDEMDAVWPDPRYLPVPAMDGNDVGAQAAGSALSLPDLPRRVAALRVAGQSKPQSREIRIRLAGVLTDVGEVDEAQALLKAIWEEDAWDWRVLWYMARVELRRYRFEEARKLFDQVCFDLPGELAPKLALGFAAELAGDLQTAEQMYDLVSRVDPNFVSAIFGLARCLQQQGKRHGAVEAFARIAPSSALFMRGRVQAARALLGGAEGDRVALEEILSAASIAETLPLPEGECCQLRREVLSAALAHAGPQKKRSAQTGALLFGRGVSERELREGLEATLRAMARLSYGEQRVRLIDEANRVRPRTLF